LSRKKDSDVQIQARMSAEYYSPIPPASEMERYQQLTPDATSRILAMAENQSSHRQEIEKIAVKSGALNSLLGVIAAFLLGAFTILGGIWLASVGAAAAGAFVASIGMAGLAWVFIYGTRSNRNERAEKSKHQ